MTKSYFNVILNLISKKYLLKVDIMSREKKIIQTSIIGIIGNFLLVGGKAFIGFLAGSIAMITDALNNLTDALSSLITIIGTKLAGKKPDKKHPYGHGRIEYLTSMVISIIIIVAGVAAIYESIKSLIENTTPNHDIYSIIIVSIAIVIKIGLGLYFRFVAKKIDSDALKASGTDALLDSLLSLSTLVAIIVSIVWKVNIEGYLGIAIGLFIIRTGIEILREGLSAIIGERADKEVTDKLKELVCSFPEVKGAYDLILNNYGPNKSIGSIHIEVRDDLTAKDIHPLTREIAAAAYIKFGIILTVGIYAKNESNETAISIKQELENILKEYPLVNQLHGFYIDEATRRVSFDLIFDFKNTNTNEQVEEIRAKIKEKYPEYEYFIVVDTDFSD